MTSRRELLKGMAVGAAAAAIPATVVASTKAGRGLFAVDGPAPWWLIAPLASGSPLALGWYIHSLGPVIKGASILTIRHASGKEARVHICSYEKEPVGLAHTALVDLVLMDGRNNDAATEEGLGRVLLGVGKAIANNETNPEGDLWPLVQMMTHDERVEFYGAEELI